MNDVLMVTYKDLANTGWRFSKCLELLGLNVKIFKGISHFDYTEQAILCNMYRIKSPLYPPLSFKSEELKDLASESKIIHFIAGTYVDTGIDLSKKKLVIQYGGRPYINTNTRKKCNSFFNKIVDATIMQYPALLGYGAKNEHLIYYPVDTEFLQPEYNNNEKVIIGHFPSNPKTKGTKEILEIIKEIENDKKYNKLFQYIGTRDINKKIEPWLEHLKKFKKCDVIIETLKPSFKGIKFGEWGNTALEAAALGKIVITNSLYNDIYKKEYGNNALNIANNKKQLKDQIIKIIQYNRDKIIEEKKKSRRWAEKKHGFIPTSERLWNKVYKDLI